MRLSQGRADEAIADFGEAVRLFPGDATSVQYLAMAHQAAGHREEAIAEFRKTLRLSPTNQPAKDGLKILGAEP